MKAPCLPVIWKFPTPAVPIRAQEDKSDYTDERVTRKIRQQAPTTSEAVRGRRGSHQELLKGKRNPLPEQHAHNREEFRSCQTGFSPQRAFVSTLALRELVGTTWMSASGVAPAGAEEPNKNRSHLEGLFILEFSCPTYSHSSGKTLKLLWKPQPALQTLAPGLISGARVHKGFLYRIKFSDSCTSKYCPSSERDGELQRPKCLFNIF